MEIRNNIKSVKLLLIEDDTADAELLEEALSRLKYMSVDLIRAESLSDALARLRAREFDIIISDLGLPDSQGLKTLINISEHVPEIPVIVLTGYDDEEAALGALKLGAQDYLVKGHIDINILYRSIRYSIERNSLIQQLKSISITDELTGLYNRRGFLMMSRKQLELASRINKTMWLIYMDVDNMKWINDNLGHEEGDNALKDTAAILKQTFRVSDILARIGGDEFAIVALEDSKTGADQMIARISNDIRNSSSQKKRAYHLSVSVGAVPCDSRPDCDISRLLTLADKLMYEQKMFKRG